MGVHRLAILAGLCLIAADAPPKAPPLALTRDERLVILGFQGRAEAVRLRADRELAAIDREQREYLGRVATRLGLKSAEELMGAYTVDFETLAVRPKEQARP